MRNNLSKLHYLLLVVFMMAMTGCGAHNLAGGSKDPGSISAKLVYKDAKTAKRLAAAPAGITSVQVTVTGTGVDGGAIPVVRGSIDTTTNTGTVSGIYPGKVTLAVKALSASGVAYEGYAIGVTVNSNATTTIANPIVMSSPLTKTQDASCEQCHETTLDLDGQNLVANFKQEGHYSNSAWTISPKYTVTGTGCAGCHGPNHNDSNPAKNERCFECHGKTGTGTALPPWHNGMGDISNKCRDCHQPHDVTKFNTGSCISCHAIAQNAGTDYVQDNNGVRAITVEFTKWSHHVTGVALQDAHCAACHLEGKVGDNGRIVVDTAIHMNGAVTHLRNADTDADMQWNPATPNHTTMDNFCMSCHDGNGATSAMSAQIQALINGTNTAAVGKTASATNPFGDTISNRYDKMQRPAVTNVDSQFNTTNNSHHGVKGPRYTGRTRTAGARQIASPAAFAANSSATLYGTRSTIYDAGNFNAVYAPLENAGGETAPRTGAASLGDDSTLHCGDCHTVGQWKVGSSVNMAGAATPVAIGAHGSNNEYLLRNNLGTDQRHTQNAFTTSGGVVTYTNPNGAFLVCYNCHAYNKYGSIYLQTGVLGGHVGEYDQAGRCNGIGNTLPFNGFTTGTATDGTQFASRFEGPITKYSSAAPYAGEQNPDFGNIFGIQCLNCHNSGLANGYGGIHGSAVNTYTDGMGNTQKAMRFLPGLGNTMYVPGTLGGITGGTAGGPTTNTRNSAGNTVYTYITGGAGNDTNWEQKESKRRDDGAAEFAGAGCYTLTEAAGKATSGQTGLSVDGGATIPEAFGTWGGCDDHGAAAGAGDHGVVKKIVRPITY